MVGDTEENEKIKKQSTHCEKTEVFVDMKFDGCCLSWFKLILYKEKGLGVVSIVTLHE